MSIGPDTRVSLLLRLPNGADVQAWREFVDVYGPLVYRLARRRGLQPSDADDLVQEALLAVARAVGDWLQRTDRGGFRAWLMRIARNLAVNFLTRPKHRAWGTGDSELAWRLTQHVDPQGDVENEFALEYQREVFWWAAERVRGGVSTAHWRAFWLSTVENQPIPAVAREVGLSVGAVYIVRSRIMAQLRERVRQFEDQSP